MVSTPSERKRDGDDAGTGADGGGIGEKRAAAGGTPVLEAVSGDAEFASMEMAGTPSAKVTVGEASTIGDAGCFVSSAIVGAEDELAEKVVDTATVVPTMASTALGDLVDGASTWGRAGEYVSTARGIVRSSVAGASGALNDIVGVGGTETRSVRSRDGREHKQVRGGPRKQR